MHSVADDVPSTVTNRLHHAAGSCGQWFRVGAVAVGLGVAITTGHGVAAAETADGGSESSDSSASGATSSQSESESETSRPSGQQTTSTLSDDQSTEAEDEADGSDDTDTSQDDVDDTDEDVDDEDVADEDVDDEDVDDEDVDDEDVDDEDVDDEDMDGSDDDVDSPEDDVDRSDADVDPQSSSQQPTSKVSAQQNTNFDSNSGSDVDSATDPAGEVTALSVVSHNRSVSRAAVEPTTVPMALSTASVPSAPDVPVPVLPVGPLVNSLWFAVRGIGGKWTNNPASSVVGTGQFVPVNALFAFGGRCGLICDGADGTQANPNGVGGGWLFGDGGDGWSSTVAGVSGGRGGDGGLLWGNGGKGGDGVAGVNGVAGTTGVNDGRGANGTDGGDGGAGGHAGLLFGRGGDGGAAGGGGAGGAGAIGADALAAEEDGGPGGAGGTGGAGGIGGAGGKGSLFGGGGDGGAGGAAGTGGAGGYGGTGGATVVTLAGGKLSDSDGAGGAAGPGGAAGQAGAGGVGGAGGLFSAAGVNGADGATGKAGAIGGEGGAGGLGGRLPLIDPNTASPAQLTLIALIKQLGLPIQAATGIQLEDITGRLVGPLNEYLYNTVIGKAIFEVGNTFSSSTLSPQVKEIIILSVGGQWGSEYELYAHKLAAQLVGVPPSAIDALANGQAPVGLAGKELIAAQFVQELVQTHRISDATYAAAAAQFTQTELVDMVNLAGTYLGVSMTLNAFNIRGPESFSPSVPPAPAPAVPFAPDGPNGLGGRLPLLDLSTATPAQVALAAQIKAIAIPTQAATGIQLLSPEGQLIGPLNAYLYNPVIGKALFDVGSAFSASTLSPRVKEVVILSVGGVWESDYEVWSHAKVARLVGIPEDAIQALSTGQPPVGLTGNELIAAQFVQELATTYRVNDELFHAAEAAFGQAGLVDLVNLASTYLGASALLNAFEVPIPPDATAV